MAAKTAFLLASYRLLVSEDWAVGTTGEPQSSKTSNLQRSVGEIASLKCNCVLILTSSWTGGRPICDRLAKVFGKPIGLLRCREYAVADICSPARQRFLQQLKTIRISANKF